MPLNDTRQAFRRQCEYLQYVMCLSPFGDVAAVLKN